MVGAMLHMLAGLVIGYLVVSMCESFFHRFIQHADPRARRLYARAGRIGQAVLDAWYSHHIVHHVLTYRKSHVAQFEDAAEQERLDALLRSRGKADVIPTRYGAAIGGTAGDFLRYMAPTLPVVGVVCLLGGGWFTAGALLPLLAWPLLAQVVHPYLHMRHDEVMVQAPLHIRVLARTWYFRHLARHHWLHHRYGDCNYNLLLGGDVVLRVHRMASREDVEAMERQGLLGTGAAANAGDEVFKQT